MATAVSKIERVVLSHDLSAFLVEFSIALHKHAIYPIGHPSLDPAAVSLTERAERLLEGRASLAFGVARRQLIIDGIATDPNQPVLSRLAETLHRHRLGAMSILSGVDSDEISAALHALAQESDAGTLQSGAAPGRISDWPHVRLHPLTLERLELVEDEARDPKNAEGRAAQLWIGLASAALASDSFEPSHMLATEPAVVAKAIDDRHGAAGYDQVIVGYLLQIADELRSASGTDLGALRRRTARLIMALRPETLQRLVEMGGDSAQRRAFVTGATSGMAIESVVKILKAAAEASNQTISLGLTRILVKLSTCAETGQDHVRPLAERALREQIDSLLSGWKLDDPNPDPYARRLQRLATRVNSDTAHAGDSGFDDEADALRILQMSLEVGSSGPLVERAVDRVIKAGNLRSVRLFLSSLPSNSGDVADMLRNKLSGPDTVTSLLAREPIDLESLDAIFPSITLDAYAVVLDTLLASHNRTTRRRLFDRLAQTDLDVAPLVVARLDDERWYVQRNLLLLLERLRRVPPGFSPIEWTRHPDARVRYQALSLQLTMPEERDLAVRAALEDPDYRVTRLGLLACHEPYPESITSVIASIALNPRVIDDLRILAVRALATSRDRVALNALLRLVDGGKSVLGIPRLASASPIVVAAVHLLAEVWRSNKPAKDMLALARGSSNPELREAAQEPLA